MSRGIFLVIVSVINVVETVTLCKMVIIICI